MVCVVDVAVAALARSTSIVRMDLIKENYHRHPPSFSGREMDMEKENYLEQEKLNFILSMRH
jgi:hypothetical protein